MHEPKVTTWEPSDRNVDISILNGALWDKEQVRCGICEIGCDTGLSWPINSVRFHTGGASLGFEPLSYWRQTLITYRKEVSQSWRPSHQRHFERIRNSIKKMECSNVKYAQPIFVIDRVRFKPEHCKLRPETGRGEDVCGVKFHPNWSVRGVNFNPNRRIKFSQKLPKKNG